MSELEPCPFCGSTHRCYLSGGANNMYETRQMAIEAWNTRVEPPELATLREQVKVLREALGWLDNEMSCRDDDFGGCLFSRQDFEIVRKALAQTKPKDGE